MPNQSGPYSRIYWRFIEEFPAIYDDDRTFATWVRLLILADGTYPQPAPLPFGVKSAVVKQLVDAGLVTLVTRNRYRIRGQVAERERRSAQGVPGAKARWSHSDGNANAMPEEKSKAENRRASPYIPQEEEPFVTLTDDEKEARKKRERDEFNARTMARLGVRP